MTDAQTVADLDTLADHLAQIEKILERLARNPDPRLAVLTALGEVDTGLRRHATQLANSLDAELQKEDEA